MTFENNKMAKFDCYGCFEPEGCYGCGFRLYMSDEEFKEWVEDGTGLPESELDFEKLRGNCERCFKMWLNDEERIAGR